MISRTPEQSPSPMKHLSARFFPHIPDAEEVIRHISGHGDRSLNNQGYLLAGFFVREPLNLDNQRTRPLSDVVSEDNSAPVVEPSILLAGICYADDVSIQSLLQKMQESGLPSPLSQSQILNALQMPAYFSLNPTGRSISLERQLVMGRGLDLLGDVIPVTQQAIRLIPGEINKNLITYRL